MRTSPRQHPLFALGAFIVLVMGGGVLIGINTAPGEWYAALAKPWFNPPNWLFGPVWTLLYLIIAVAGWRIWRHDRHGAAMRLWYVQLALNFSWSPIFFLAHRIDMALAVIVCLLFAILALVSLCWRRDFAASLLFVPYALWVGFAALLNAAILHLNGPTG